MINIVSESCEGLGVNDLECAESIMKIKLSPNRTLKSSSPTELFMNENEEGSPRKGSQTSATNCTTTNIVTKILKPHEVDLGITLVAISMMFIFCQSIKVIPDIYEMITCDHFALALKDNEMERLCSSTLVIDTFASLGNLFCCINSAGNFLLYMLRGKKFRDAFTHTYFFWIHQGSSSNKGKKYYSGSSNCLKITQNVAFDFFSFWHFPPIFVLSKLTCLVALFDRKLQVFKNSPN